MRTFGMFGYLCVFGVAVLGCTSTVVEPVPETLARPAVGTRPAAAGFQIGVSPAASDIVTGYNHTPASSRFWYGGSKSVEVGTGFERQVGTEGASITMANGFFAARPNAGAAINSIAPFATSGAAHNARVVAYFSGTALPMSQVGPVHSNTMLDRSGNTVTGASTTRLRGYVSVLDRTVDGVRVEGSYAWAQFNKNEDVVAEEVWWPELPATVHQKIAELRGILGTPSAIVAWKAKLPSELQPESGEIVVHHARPTVDAWFVEVTVDFQKRGRLNIPRYTAAGTSFEPPAIPLTANSKTTVP